MVIVPRGGAAHAQYRLCARITERLPKILKIYTESTVDGLGALGLYTCSFGRRGARWPGGGGGGGGGSNMLVPDFFISVFYSHAPIGALSQCLPL